MAQIKKNINEAKTLDSDFYLNHDFFNESKNIFEASIQLICSRNDLSELSIFPINYFPDFLNESLLITNNNGSLRCLSNVCTHRGHILSECISANRFLQCRYHGRTFNLNGKIKNAPGFDNAINFPGKDDNLREASIYNWNEFLFISLSDDSRVFDKLNQIDQVLPSFPYSKLSRNSEKKDYIIDVHWALYCDNYLEGFHIPYVHKGLNEDMDWKNYSTDILDEIVLQKAIAKDSKDAILYDGKGNIYAYYFFIFPNTMINYYRWGVSINIIEPISPEKTRISVIKAIQNGINVIHIEDQGEKKRCGHLGDKELNIYDD